MATELIACADGNFHWAGRSVRCALGRGGVVPARDKREGDGASPAGLWPLRYVLHRPDRLARPPTRLAVRPIGRDDGWCDDPLAPALYNRPVKRPCPHSHEALWREDGLYDLLVVLGYNDAPARVGHGSAIFLHLARKDYSPTEGCVALARPDMLEVLAVVASGDGLRIRSS